jgi:hypothetical protein
VRSAHIKLGCLHEFRIYVPVPPYFPTTLSRPLRSRQPLASTCQSNLHKIPFRELNRIFYKARINLLCSVLFFFFFCLITFDWVEFLTFLMQQSLPPSRSSSPSNSIFTLSAASTAFPNLSVTCNIPPHN